VDFPPTVLDWLVFDWRQSLSHLTHMAIAYVLALPIGLNRQTSSRNFGLRTFPLVSVVSCGFMLVGIAVIDSTDGEARVIQGIVTGIGFIGGGAIFKGEDNVTGMASAASLWNTGAIGIAVAFDRFDIALALSLLNFVTLYLVGRLQKSVDTLHENDHNEADQ
jgi:putative Mg2+ transporter-C (MgtC) family protein